MISNSNLQTVALHWNLKTHATQWYGSTTSVVYTCTCMLEGLYTHTNTHRVYCNLWLAVSGTNEVMLLLHDENTVRHNTNTACLFVCVSSCPPLSLDVCLYVWLLCALASSVCVWCVWVNVSEESSSSRYQHACLHQSEAENESLE